MNYADIRKFDTTNGTGISSTLFVSGCNFKCHNCFNKEAQNFNYGNEFTKDVEDKFIEYCKNEHVNHISILGGEPFQQDLDIMLSLVKRIKKETSKPICIWSGFKWEELMIDCGKKEILKYVTVLTDGRFVQKLKDLNLNFKGSSNQKSINVQRSLKENKIILWEWGDDYS